MKKIMIVVHSITSGGAERVSANLANYLDKLGVKVLIVNYLDDEDFYEVNESIVRIHMHSRYHGIAGSNLRRVFAVRKIIKEQAPDVVLGMTTTSAVIVAMASLGLKVRAFGAERTFPPNSPVSLPWKMLRFISYRFLTGVIVQTKRGKEWLQSELGLKNVKVVPNPLKMPLDIRSPKLDPKDTLSENTKVVLGVGRLCNDKGFDRLIAALYFLNELNDDWVLVLLGEGEDRELLTQLSKKLGIENRVLMLGKSGNISEWYYRSSIYVMSSRNEGFPNSLVEALGHGLPVISFDCQTGPKEIIEQHVNGILVPNGDIDLLSKSIFELINCKKRRKELSNQAIISSIKYSEDKVMQKWLDCFHDYDKGY
ncbi:glycosyltransferase family 4 protein [Vibrio sp. LaRot3]|uniref:glycosyltransferase family 4 protein n=1 Tax=Vibrio sp. LaRot3 TaxID=2998829 RepID=UPI0022CE1635|nr:glycosyltransferase family 4 protein [Vibrio sp. LaRot3]MDA0149398.1 glycosyltransferase family 4 protein [Vibrio sp. LaRot3]